MSILKVIAISLLLLSILIVITASILLHLMPQFGGKIVPNDLLPHKDKPNFNNGKFYNIEEFSSHLGLKGIVKVLIKFFKKIPNKVPSSDIVPIPFSFTSNEHESMRVTWLGHSSFHISIANKTILLDPVFSQYAAPFSFLSTKRYNSKMPMSLDSLKNIDYVIISHDHYDHLDHDTIKEIKNKTNKFLVPCGVSKHLIHWGVDKDKIVEAYWWDEIKLDNFNFIFTPTKHMSGRGLFDHKTTLWGSWIISHENQKLFFSGDGGYGSHFKDIGNKYGPFDITLVECGQYDEYWPNVHMTPEETITAAKDLKSKLLLPIHWGAFTLANHTWTDPVKRALNAAAKLSLDITTPQIGESFYLSDEKYPDSKWWEEYES